MPQSGGVAFVGRRAGPADPATEGRVDIELDRPAEAAGSDRVPFLTSIVSRRSGAGKPFA